MRVSYVQVVDKDKKKVKCSMKNLNREGFFKIYNAEM